MFEHRCESADAARGERVHWSRGDRVDADIFRTEIRGEIVTDDEVSEGAKVF